MDDRYTVIRDTREKPNQGWTFSETTSCFGTKIATLKTGDYTLLGMENLFCIERKGCVSEFATNLVEARFEKELERMTKFKWGVVLLEFDMDDILSWPRSSGIPRSKWYTIKMTNYFILNRFLSLKLKYSCLDFMFAGVHGREVASSMFKRVVERYG